MSVMVLSRYLAHFVVDADLTPLTEKCVTILK